MKIEYGPSAPGGVQQLLAMGGDTGEMVTIHRDPPGVRTMRSVAKFGFGAWIVGSVFGMSRVAGAGRVAIIGALGAYYLASEAQRRMPGTIGK